VKLLPDCQEVSRLLSDGQDQRLPIQERARVRLHLVMCDTCRNVEGQMAFLRQAMRELGRREPPER
jgi:predicted anti-sigma-YlaC factor YlaD